MSSFSLLATWWYCLPSAGIDPIGLQVAYNPEPCACGISAIQFQFPTMSTVPYLTRDRTDIGKTGTEQLSTIILPDVQMTAAPGVKGEPDAVLRRSQDDLMSYEIHTTQ